METVTVKLPPDLSSRLSLRARESSRSKSEIIRQALRAQLNGEKKSESLLDRAADLAGKYASGRKNSSHKKHLDTFGLKSLGRWKRS